MCDLNFVTKHQIRKTKEPKTFYDVKVNLSKHKANGMLLTFKNSCFDRFAPNHHIKYAIRGSRLYFAEADENDGWLLRTSGKEVPGTLYTQLPRSHEEATLFALNYAGKYQLLYDNEAKCFCIDANGAAS